MNNYNCSVILHAYCGDYFLFCPLFSLCPQLKINLVSHARTRTLDQRTSRTTTTTMDKRTVPSNESSLVVGWRAFHQCFRTERTIGLCDSALSAVPQSFSLRLRRHSPSLCAPSAPPWQPFQRLRRLIFSGAPSALIFFPTRLRRLKG